MSQAAYGTIIYSVGDPVIFNGEDTTDIGSNQFQINDVSRRLFNPDTEVSAYDDGVEIEISNIDYFNGIVTLSSAPTDPALVTIDGAFVTKVMIGGSKDYNFEIGGDILDNTSFQTAQTNGGWRTRCYGLHDVTVSISRYDDLTGKFRKHKSARERVYIEILPGGGISALKGWFVIEASSFSGDIGSLEEESLSFNLASIGSDQQGGVGTVFSFT